MNSFEKNTYRYYVRIVEAKKTRKEAIEAAEDAFNLECMKAFDDAMQEARRIGFEEDDGR